MHSRRLISLGVMGCHVNYIGLLALGASVSVCRQSLRDLHLSSNLSDRRVFYAIPELFSNHQNCFGEYYKYLHDEKVDMFPKVECISTPREVADTTSEWHDAFKTPPR
mmetsp:Transcript_12685/g.19052  ORF Transcript_12685/g.19052 Transcript_12685/m.19052 type:complete len:108 (+) Transcript_12685:527-850(+)